MSNAPHTPQSRLWYVLLTLAVVAVALVGYAGYALYPRFGLPAVQGVSMMLLSVAAGVGSFFSPCSFPLLVTLLARHGGGQAPEITPTSSSAGRVFIFAAALATGAAVFLLLAGVVLALGGEVLFAGVTFTSVQGRLIRALVGGILLVLGFIQLGKLPFTLSSVGRLANPLMQAQARKRRQHPVIGFLILGFAYPLAGFG